MYGENLLENILTLFYLSTFEILRKGGKTKNKKQSQTEIILDFSINLLNILWVQQIQKPKKKKLPQQHWCKSFAPKIFDHSKFLY